MTSWYIKASSAWKQVNQAFVKSSSAWKEIQEGYIKVGGAWKSFYVAFVATGFTTQTSNTTVTVPDGANAIHVQAAVGGGSGGVKGADYDKAGGESAGAGGASGGYVSDEVYTVSEGETLTLTIGAAGTASTGSAYNTTAGNGGNTVLSGSTTGAIFTLAGGTGGSGVNGGVQHLLLQEVFENLMAHQSHLILQRPWTKVQWVLLINQAMAPQEQILETVAVTTVLLMEEQVLPLTQVVFQEAPQEIQALDLVVDLVHEDQVVEVVEHKFLEVSLQQVEMVEQEKYVIDFYESIKEGK